MSKYLLRLKKILPFLKFAKNSQYLKLKFYISYGMWKSGSTYAFELTKAMFAQNGYPQPRLSDDAVEAGHHINFVRDWTGEQLKAIINEAEEHGTIIVLKTHRSPSSKVIELLNSNLAVGHAVYRDPRDMALSLLDAGSLARKKGNQAFSYIYSLDDAIKRIHSQIKIFNQWAALTNIEPIAYNQFTQDPLQLAHLISEQTGMIPYELKDAHKIKQDSFIQFNKGQQHRYVTEMSITQREIFQEKFKYFYKKFFE
jgi:hypothetical protein